MKKILLSLIFFFSCLFSIQAQTLFGTTFKGGKDDGGTLIKFEAATNSTTVLKSFEIPAANPYYTSFIQASDGKLYGMTSEGGDSQPQGANNDYGVIFSFDPFTSTYTKLKNFDGTNGKHPRGSLMQASNGKLYGMTQYGGSSDAGVIFSFDFTTSTYTKLKDFDGVNGGYPMGGLMQASDGKLYGMASGAIFSFDPSTSTYTKLKDLDGSSYGSLIQASDRKLYGMTNGGGSSGFGVIFSFDPSTSVYTKLKDFDGTNGSNPYGSLIQRSDGKLYGMTNSGGDSGFGVIFSFDPSTFTYIKLKDFDGTNGAVPYGNLVQASDGKLYATTYRGGSKNAGVIFSFDLTTSTYTKLKDFGNNNRDDGTNPYGSLMQASNGKLYGMTTYGGSSIKASWFRGDNGVIFSFDPPSSTYTKLMNLDGNNGGSPCGALIRANDGKLYDMTQYGGNNGLGTIFSFDLLTSTYKKLIDLDSTNGAKPFGSLMQASDGKLYGMTSEGGSFPFRGSSGNGVIFSFDPVTSIYKKLVEFGVGAAADCYQPYGSLMQASDGKLYGMAVGGSSGYGVIFSFDPSTSTFTKVMDFDGANGRIMYSNSLMQASDGKLYGMTGGDLSGIGSVFFSFNLSTSTFTKLNDLGGFGSLMQASNGKLYGMTSGSIFSFDPSTSTYTKLKDFNFSIEGNPLGGNLMQASDGKLYGMTYGGGLLYGSYVHGVIFSFDPSTSTYTKLKDFDGANGAFPFFGSGFIEISNSGGNGTIPALSIAISSGTNTICAGQSITFTATPTNGGTSPTYQWKMNGTDVGTNSPTYNTNTLTNGQVVSCVMVSNAPNANPTTATSNTITMTVNAVVIPTIVITQTSCRGDTAIFSSTITNGGTAPAYLWTFTGTGTATNITGSNFALNAASNGNQVQCRLTSNAACVNPVQVNSLPLIINCTTTGVSNIDDLEEFKIMSNPNNGLFTVKIKLSNQREVRFTLVNSLGRVVYQSPSTRMNGTQTKQISVSSLPGVYFLKTEIGNQVIYKRIVIMKN